MSALSLKMRFTMVSECLHECTIRLGFLQHPLTALKHIQVCLYVFGSSAVLSENVSTEAALVGAEDYRNVKFF